MPIIIGVKFNNKGKVYYFDPLDIGFAEGDGVIVDTAKGEEYAIVTIPNKNVGERDIVAPLKSVVRRATQDDDEIYKRNKEEKAEAIAVASEKIRSRGLAMKLVDAEYSFDRSKLVIYFTAPGRVDFRELVKDLAAIFKTRIELRQIYERDEAKMKGSLANCGRPCCCYNHLADFEKVSIKMAKIQGLSLNPQKISGVCGRLMCCLAYENAYYKEMFKEMPRVGTSALTPDGNGTVESNDILRQTSKIKICLPDGSFDIRVYNLKDLKKTVKQSEREIADDDAGADLKALE
ncbi:MAG: stage 0 sporulation family protein [Clostridiales bacterium]|jgi:cell fate regulator YaaT (PSP1 superfamily)|nr:stage 0 sporulation family protein [Clostridiales bacterium]